MSNLPESDLRHPAWCAGEPVCTAFTQPAAPFHRSAPARIEAELYGEPDITIVVQADSDEPIETAAVSLLLAFDTGGLVPDVHGYVLEARQAVALLEALAPFVAILAAR